jgi:hypothetical protein
MLRLLYTFKERAITVSVRLYHSNKAIVMIYLILALIGSLAGRTLYQHARQPLFQGGPPSKSFVHRDFINNLAIQTIDPDVSMKVGESIVIHSSVKIIPPEVQQYTHQSFQLDIGGPSLPITAAFGPGYETSASASLNASSFDIDPRDIPAKPISEGSPTDFYWTITPKSAGKQVLSLSFTGIWTGDGKRIERSLAQQTIDLTVDPIQPTRNTDADGSGFMRLGHIEAGEVLTTLVGGLLLPGTIWLLARLFHRVRMSRKKKRHVHQSKK